MSARLILLAAGGTGGHLFPAEALAGVLIRRGHDIALVSDERALAFAERFPGGEVHALTSGTVTGTGLLSKLRGAIRLVLGTREALGLIGRRKPAVVVGFGGYPTVPPIYAATMRRVPTLIHEANAVMGRANRFLAPRVRAIATGFPLSDAVHAAKIAVTGNPVREAVTVAAKTPLPSLGPADPIHILIFAGSQGARVMADVVPSALAGLPDALKARVRVTQQARPEDAVAVRAHYLHQAIAADVKSFFPDLPARIAASHVVIARAGASTVSELAAIGRPSILVPLPGALDQDQAANAQVLEKAGGAILIRQDGFTPHRLSDELEALAAAPDRLAAMAAGARTIAMPDAAERLADLALGLVRD